MTFSVVCIARNESKTLPRLINSLKEFQERGGEILIVDTGSIDGTAEIARNLGCKVEEVGDRFRITIDEDLAKQINGRFVVESESPVVVAGESLFDFTSARNFAASLASNDTVAMPDCDEIYTKIDLDKIEEAINNGAEQLEYNFVFSHDQFGNEVIKFMHSKFYNRTKLKWTGVVHEVLTGSATRKFLDESIIKLEHYQNHETNRSGYLKGLALDCFQNPENDRNSHYFGREMLWTGRPKSAIQELERHVSMMKWPAERSQSLVYIGKAYEGLGMPEKALQSWFQAWMIEPARREPLICIADYYYRTKQACQAATFAKACLEIPGGNFYADDVSHYRHVPHEILYWAYWNLGDLKQGKEHYDIALGYLPLSDKFLHDARFFYDLPKVSIILPTKGRPEGLKRALDSVEMLNYPKELIELIVDGDPGTVPEKVKRMQQKATGTWYCYASNDIEFTANSLILAVLDGLKNKKGLISFNTGELYPDKGNICEHFIIQKYVLDQIGGEIFNTRFHHCGCDNLLWAQCSKINEAFRSESAIMHHYHFTRGAKMDEIYSEAWSRNEEDKKILEEELEKLTQS